MAGRGAEQVKQPGSGFTQPFFAGTAEKIKPEDDEEKGGKRLCAGVTAAKAKM